MKSPITRDGRRIVEVAEHGEGAIPRYAEACPYGGDISCVSRSGDSLCGGYTGGYTAESRRFVLCGEPDTFGEGK